MMHAVSRRTFLTQAFAGATLATSVTRSAAANLKRPFYRSAYRIVDFHGHGLPIEDALSAHREAMELAGVDAFTILLYDPSGWHFTGGWSEENLRAWTALQRKAPNNLVICSTVDFGRAAKEPGFFEAIVEELERHAQMGAQGVKIWKNLGLHHRDRNGKLLRLDDRRLDAFWTKCGELRLPVWIHVADPKEYWSPTFKALKPQFHLPGGPSWEELIQQHNVVLERHPKTSFVGCHFGNYSSDLKRLGKTLDRFPNFQVECASRLRYFAPLPREVVRDFFAKYQDRVLFGADLALPNTGTLKNRAKLAEWVDDRARIYSWYLEYFETDHQRLPKPPLPAELVVLDGLALAPAILEKFYFANAARLIPSLKG